MKWGFCLKYSLTIKNLNETISIGRLLGSFLEPSMVIGLDGELGSGKTHLTKSIALGLDIKSNITSPTFSLINEYTEGRLSLYHFDVYRLNSIDELFLIGFDDYIRNNGIKIIEWASMVKDILPLNTNYINIYKTKENENSRIIEFDFSPQFDHVLNNAINAFNKEE